MRSEQEQVTATGNTYGEFGEICDRKHRQTNRHTDTLIAKLRSPTAGEIITRDWTIVIHSCLRYNRRTINLQMMMMMMMTMMTITMMKSVKQVAYVSGD